MRFITNIVIVQPSSTVLFWPYYYFLILPFRVLCNSNLAIIKSVKNALFYLVNTIDDHISIFIHGLSNLCHMSPYCFIIYCYVTMFHGKRLDKLQDTCHGLCLSSLDPAKYGRGKSNINPQVLILQKFFNYEHCKITIVICNHNSCLNLENHIYTYY